MSIAQAIANRIRELEAIPLKIASTAAPRILAKVKADATTKRGNVPAYGKMGDPITATPSPEGVTLTAPAWVLAKARSAGTLDSLSDIIADAAREEVA